MTEATFILDSFNNNMSLTGIRAVYRQIYNLLLMKEGTDPLNPAKGCNIKDKVYYQPIDSVNIMNLEQKIKDQIIKYTDYTINTIKCNIINKDNIYYLYVIISSEPMGETYIVVSDGNRVSMSQLETPSSKLSSALNN